MTNRSNLIQDVLRAETTATEYKKYIVFCGKNPTEEKIRKMMGFTLTEMQRWNSTKSDPIELINDIIAERKSELQYYNDITENITKRMGAISNEAAKAALIAINADRQNGKTPLYVCCCAQCHNLVNVENTIESERVFQNLFDSENSHTKMLPLQICTKCAEKEYIKELEEDAAFDKMCDEKGNNHAIHQLLQIRRQRIQSLKQILYPISQRTEKKKSQNNSRCQRRMVRFRRTNHVDHNYSR